jgi:prefoldin subunit 5
MTLKKNNPTKYVSVMQDDRAYQISFWRALAIISGAILVSVVGTAFTTITILNTDHFTIVGLGHRVSALETITVRQDVLSEQLSPMRNDISEIKSDIKQLIKETNKKTND